MFGKFMNKKFFHPGSYPNVKMRWIHEQRDAAKKKAEEEKQSTYQKEQESYQSRMLSAKSSEEKMKLDLNFLYDLPPGMRTEKEKDKEGEEEEEVEVKFEWQKNAPRSKYVNDLGLECQDQPFGVCVRNIRCFKCRAWGHQNTDRECPLYFSNLNSEAEGNSQSKGTLRLSDPLLLIGAMKEQHGISLKKSVIGQEIDPMADHQKFLPSDEEQELGNDDLEFVQSLTDKQKRKLLKRLNKMEKNEEKDKKKKKKEKKEKKKKKKKRSNSSSSDEEEEDQNHKMKQKGARRQIKGKKKNYSSSDEENHRTKKQRKYSYSSSSEDEKSDPKSNKSIVKSRDKKGHDKYKRRRYSSSSDNDDEIHEKKDFKKSEIRRRDKETHVLDNERRKLSGINNRNKQKLRRYDYDKDEQKSGSDRNKYKDGKRGDDLESGPYDEIDKQLHMIRKGLQ